MDIGKDASIHGCMLCIGGVYRKNYIRVLRISWFRTLEMQYINIIPVHSMSKLCFTSLS